MKSKGKTAQKKEHTGSAGAPGAGRRGPGTGARRTSAQIEARFRAVFESSRDAIGVSKAGIHVFVNPAYLDLFGFPPGADLAGKPILDLIAPESRDQIRAYIRRRLRGDDVPPTYETRGLRTDGTAFDMEVDASSYQENGEVHTLVILRDITRRKMAEEEIAARGAMLQQIMDTASVAIGLVDKTGRITHANRRMAEMFGRTLEELVGCEYVELVHPSERETGRKNMLALLASEIPSVDLERLYRRKDGTVFWGHLACKRFYDVHGIELGLIGVITDITVRKRSEDALKESEEKYRRLYNETPVLLQSIDRDARIVDVNDYWLKTMGYERNEVIGRKVTDFYTDASREYAREVVQPAFFRDGIAKDISYQFVKKNGEVVDVLLSATAERDPDGNVVRSRAVIVDITERTRAEEALRESVERFRAITTTASDAILLMDDTGKIVYWNPAAGRMFGYSAEEAIGKDLHLFLGPERLHENFRKGYANFVKTGRGAVINRTVELAAVKKDGREFPIEVSTSAMYIDGRWHALGIVRDITERKRAEEALRENQARLDLALQAAHMGVWRWEIKENRSYFDGLTCRLLGIEPATFTGTAEEFFRAVHPEDREKIKEALARTIERDVPYEPVYRVVWPDGSVRYVTARGSLVRDGKGQPARINGILWDITDQHLYEQELIKTQKLESVGTLAGGIAHDFNNLLQGIFGYISMAKLTRDQKEKSLAMLEQAEKALHQTVNLTSQLLTFSKGGKPLKKVFALGPVIENAVKFALSGSPVVSELFIDGDLRAVDADEGQIGQVIQNIVLNAEQAMPLGGRITIKAENAPASGVPSLPGEAAENYVAVSVRDHGTGIPPEHLPRIFDPYFTTKEKGSGLGLATSYSIIKNHGGAITVASELGKGSTFTLYLPASTAPAEQAEHPPERMAARRGRVLVMDDEDLVRDVAGELIRALGHEVEFAEEGKAALMQYRGAMAAGRPFDVVILDLTVRGGMGGVETLRKLAEIDPGVKAVVSSGYSDDAALSDYREQGFRAFLKKPYEIEDLQSTLNALLA